MEMLEGNAKMLGTSVVNVLENVPGVNNVLSALASDKGGAAAPSWTVTLVVKLPDPGSQSETVTLTVHTQGPMTLEWPGFGGVRAGKAAFGRLPQIEPVLNKSAAAGSPRKASKSMGMASRVLGRSGRVDPESVSRSPKHLEGAHEATGHRDAAMEDVHAMVMAMVDQELREEREQNWPRPAETKSLLTLRDFTGAMLVHNLLLAGAQGKDPRAHKLFLEIVHKIPRLLLDVHDGSLIFHGEGPLHVLAVNGREMDEAEVVEKVLVDCLRTFRRGIAERKISPEELVSSRQWEDEEVVKSRDTPHTQGTKSPDTAIPRYDEAMKDGEVKTNYPCAMNSPCSINGKARDQLMRPLLECDANSDGEFFKVAPMKYFGGTPIAYFAVFGMKELLQELVGEPKKVAEARKKAEFDTSLLPAAQRLRVEQAREKTAIWMQTTLNGMPMPQPMPGPLSPQERYYLVNELRSKHSQYLPIHAVTASDNHVMYDFMVDICGANDMLEVEELSALKLAVVLGKQAMVKHILKRRLKIAWTWGPVTQYMIPLDEIDTAGKRVMVTGERCLGNLQLLELVVAPNAKKVTSQMMEDDFMNGFFFKLIETKWYNNGRNWYCLNVGFHFFFTFQLTFLAAPSILDPRLAEPIPSRVNGSQLQLAMLLSLILLEEELREIGLWIYVRKLRFTWRQMLEAPLGRGIAIRELGSCMLLRRAHFRLPMALLTLVAAIIETHISTLHAETEAGDRYGPGSDQSDLMSQARALEEWPNICLAFAAALAWWLLMLDAFQWSEELGVFSAMVLKMLSGDILSKFLPLYVPILLAFTTSMHAINPQKTTHDSRWSSWWQTFESLVLFSLVGEPPDIALGVEGTGDIHPVDMFWDRHFRPEFTEGLSKFNWSAGGFVILYILFLFVVLLLLINLLIAMMSSTYENEKDSARLQWRILFARLVLRYELLNLPLAMLDPKRHETRVMLGKKSDPGFQYTHSPFRSYDKDAHLNLDSEGGDLFADSEGDGQGAEAPAAGPAESAEAKREHVEAVARRTAEIVLEQLAQGGAKHGIDPRAIATHFQDRPGTPPRRMAASDREVQRSASRSSLPLPLPPVGRCPPPLKLVQGHAAFGGPAALPPPYTPTLGEGGASALNAPSWRRHRVTSPCASWE
jgi:hypothetical protein